MMRNKTKVIFMYILGCTWLGTLLALSMPRLTMTNDIKEENVVLIDTISKTPSVSKKDSIKNKLIEEVENYAYCMFPKTHKTIPTSIVENGLKNDIDIMFMMAQTQIETSFGTAGAGRETSRRSLFGVAIKKYGTYESAVQSYISILKKYYLTKGRTEQHLMNRYTTTSGARYAGDPNYEARLKSTYSVIKKKTNISKLQKEYRELVNKESES